MTPILVTVTILLILAAAMVVGALVYLYIKRNKSIKREFKASKVSSRISRCSEWEPAKQIYPDQEGNDLVVVNPDDVYTSMDEEYEIPQTTYSKLFSRTTFQTFNIMDFKKQSLASLVRGANTVKYEEGLAQLNNMSHIDIVLRPELIK
eukprot:NODE_239_length_11955_cov_0.931174.p9 type:complete len:149 gc:universal NODE_239_length_11955_cov_0.931174:10026-10472(+)